MNDELRKTLEAVRKFVAPRFKTWARPIHRKGQTHWIETRPGLGFPVWVTVRKDRMTVGKRENTFKRG